MYVTKKAQGHPNKELPKLQHAFELEKAIDSQLQIIIAWY
jgi:hypothetical protein